MSSAIARGAGHVLTSSSSTVQACTMASVLGRCPCMPDTCRQIVESSCGISCISGAMVMGHRSASSDLSAGIDLSELRRSGWWNRNVSSSTSRRHHHHLHRPPHPPHPPLPHHHHHHRRRSGLRVVYSSSKKCLEENKRGGERERGGGGGGGGGGFGSENSEGFESGTPSKGSSDKKCSQAAFLSIDRRENLRFMGEAELPGESVTLKTSKNGGNEEASGTDTWKEKVIMRKGGTKDEGSVATSDTAQVFARACGGGEGGGERLQQDNGCQPEQQEGIDIVILSNGPGEVAAWVRPVVRALRRRLGNDRNELRISVVLSPCPHASGQETAFLHSFNEVDRCQDPSGFWDFVLWGRTADYWDWRSRGICIFLGGDQLNTLLIGWRLGYKTMVYAEDAVRWAGFADMYLLRTSSLLKSVFPSLRHRCRVIGDLFADAVVEDEPSSVNSSLMQGHHASLGERISDQGSGSQKKNYGRSTNESLGEEVGSRLGTSIEIGDGIGPLVGLLPGSKKVKLMLGVPFMMAAADQISERLPCCRFVIPLAPTVDVAAIAEHADARWNPIIDKLGWSSGTVVPIQALRTEDRSSATPKDGSNQSNTSCGVLQPATTSYSAIDDRESPLRRDGLAECGSDGHEDLEQIERANAFHTQGKIDSIDSSSSAQDVGTPLMKGGVMLTDENQRFKDMASSSERKYQVVATLETSKGTSIMICDQFPPYDVYAECALCLTTIGTNTAELGTLGIPMVVILPSVGLEVFRGAVGGIFGLIANVPGWIGTAVAKTMNMSLLKTAKYIAWPNRWAGEEIVPELIGDVTPADVADAALRLLTDPDKLQDMRSQLLALRGERSSEKENATPRRRHGRGMVPHHRRLSHSQSSSIFHTNGGGGEEEEEEEEEEDRAYQWLPPTLERSNERSNSPLSDDAGTMEERGGDDLLDGVGDGCDRSKFSTSRYGAADAIVDEVEIQLQQFR